jgi:hypothetical protein
MRKRWAKWIEHDPAYNPNLTLNKFDFSIAEVSRLDFPWRQAIQGK